MSFLERFKALLKGEKVEPTQTEEARVTQAQRVLDDHPSNKITPAKLKMMLDEAENGDITAQHQLFMDIEERDSAIAANMLTRKRALLTLSWRICEPRHATPQEEKLQAEIEELFYQYPNLEDLLIDLMDAVGHGFSALEIQWKLIDGKWQPVGFVSRPQSWFKLDKDDKLLLKTPDNPMGEPLRPFGWVVHFHKNRSTQLARNGLYRSLAWLYMFKHYSVHDFAEFLELYGMPIRIGKYGAGATDNEKKTLLRALASIGHNAAGIMPESMKIELHNVASSGAASGNNPFLQMVDWCEKSIARLILGQTLTSGADGKSSTNALGVVHNEVRRDLLVSDAKQVAQTITKQIILPYLQINVDPTIAPHRVPYFEFDTKEYADLSTLAEALPKLVDVGVVISESWARDQMGIPELQEGEVALARVSSSDSPPTVPLGHLPPQAGEGKLKEAVENEKENSGKKTTALSAQMGKVHAVGCDCAHCRGVALSRQAVRALQTKEQNALDDCVDDALTRVDFNAQLNPMVQTAVAVLKQCDDYESALEKLAEIYPQLDSGQHQQYLTQGLFVSELLGAENVRH